MPATIERRVVALETSAGAGDKCPGCGFGRYEKPPLKVHIVAMGRESRTSGVGSAGAGCSTTSTCTGGMVLGHRTYPKRRCGEASKGFRGRP